MGHGGQWVGMAADADRSARVTEGSRMTGRGPRRHVVCGVGRMMWNPVRPTHHGRSPTSGLYPKGEGLGSRVRFRPASGRAGTIDVWLHWRRTESDSLCKPKPLDDDER